MNDLVGLRVVYVSSSNKEYDAVITALPINPYHGEGKLPTVSLEFRDERGKLKVKQRVLHLECSSYKTQIWKFHKVRTIPFGTFEGYSTGPATLRDRSPASYSKPSPDTVDAKNFIKPEDHAAWDERMKQLNDDENWNS